MFTYGLFDYDPEQDGDEAAWARTLADQTWRSWDAGSGPWITLEGRRLRRWSLRRKTRDMRAIAIRGGCYTPGNQERR